MIYNVDCLEWLRDCPKYHTIFADPPDNLGLNYNKFKDNDPHYYDNLELMMDYAIKKSEVFWLSYYWRHDLEIKRRLASILRCHYPSRQCKSFVWRYTFGQHLDNDCGSGFRWILRVSSPAWRPHTDGIRVPSERQALGDIRAAGPRVPDDVWDFDCAGVWDEFPRVVGNSSERREWHPTQHPEALLERILRLSGSTSVLDCYLGTGTTLRVCQALGIEADGCEIDPDYCAQIAKELRVDWRTI